MREDGRETYTESGGRREIGLMRGGGGRGRRADGGGSVHSVRVVCAADQRGETRTISEPPAACFQVKAAADFTFSCVFFMIQGLSSHVSARGVTVRMEMLRRRDEREGR